MPKDSEIKWLIYGAYGYTGSLLVKVACEKGFKPVLAGRDEEKLRLLAEEYKLEYKVFSLDDEAVVYENTRGYDVIYNLAGPYDETAEILIKAALENRCHYFDLAGDFNIYDLAYSYHEQALERGIAIIPGTGFNTLATETLGAFAASKIENVHQLDVAIAALTNPSKGTFNQALRMLQRGGFVVKDGKISDFPLGKGIKKIKFPHAEMKSFPVPLGELSALKRSTNAKNVRCYLSLSGMVADSFEYFGDLLVAFSTKSYGKAIIKKTAKSFFSGPSLDTNLNASAYVWARASNKSGDNFEVIMQTPEAYYFTVLASLEALREITENPKSGSLSTSQAFGINFPLKIEGVKRSDVYALTDMK